MVQALVEAVATGQSLKAVGQGHVVQALVVIRAKCQVFNAVRELVLPIVISFR